ncbi:peptidoglycan-binding protein, partial [Caulobacter sp. 17J65-9]|uniref:chitosanase n=1 Tax=Caulobacter sp. 17J65-9 TaxID=2709382 RepID=UPI0013C5C67A
MQLTQLQRSAAQAIVSIFETGRPTGGYGRVTVLQGDTGRLTYGRFQTTLGSGALYFLIKDYVERPGAIYVSALAKYLGRLLKRDGALDHDGALHRTLKAAGEDPVMRQAQDDFFDRNFWTPAVAAARALGVTTPLGVAVIYDSKVHGSFERVRDRTLRQVGPPSAVGEETWISAYVANRRAYLAQHAQPILRKTVYRMAAFERLIRDDNWDLDLPFKVGGFRIDEKTLRAGPAKGRAARILAPADTPMKGDDVREVQARLRELGYGADPTGAYDDDTVELVRKFQEAHGLKVDGAVGPATRASLETARPATPNAAHAEAAPEPAVLAAAPHPA